MKINHSRHRSDKVIFNFIISLLIICILLGSLFTTIIASNIHNDPDIFNLKHDTTYDIGIDIRQPSEINHWQSELDFSQDSLVLFPEQNRAIFKDCFDGFKISIIGLVTENSPSRSLPKNYELIDRKTDQELLLLENSDSDIIREYIRQEVRVAHTFNKIQDTNLGLKQTVTLFNPSEFYQEYRISFIFESPFNMIKYDNSIKSLDNEPIIFESEQTKITFLDEQPIEQASFNWYDLVSAGFSPEVKAYYKEGHSTIECSIEVSLSPDQDVCLDPTYILENAANSRLYHDQEHANLGSSMATGDINNDGYDDLIFSAPNVDSGPGRNRTLTGEIYLIYGKPRSKFGDYLNFSYSEDVVIYGESYELSLQDASITTGDINNDGYDDIVIGAPTANLESNWETGLVYVIFGGSDLNKTIDLAVTSEYDLSIIGFKEDGRTGEAVATGDVNGDGFDDILVSSPYATFINISDQDDTRDMCGYIHVIYGNTTMQGSYQLISTDGYNMQIFGEDADDNIGISLGVGDINGDGFGDIVFGSPNKDASCLRTRNSAGHVDVIFGNQNLSKQWDMRNYQNITQAKQGKLNSNMTIIGANEYDYMGSSIYVADMNNDDFDDILIGVPNANGRSEEKTKCGEVYVVYGDTENNLITFMDGINMTKEGYVIYGQDDFDGFGTALAVRDIDGDGFKDMLIGAPGGRGINNEERSPGEAYLILSSSKKEYGYLEIEPFPTTSQITILYGTDEYANVGSFVVSGDLDHDSRGEIIIAAPSADSFDGVLFNVGRIEIIFKLNLTPKINHIKFELLDGGGKNGTICYAGSEHTFQIKVFNSLGITNHNFTQISLAPDKLDIRFAWSQADNTFFKVPGSDRSNYVTLNKSGCVSRIINKTLLELEFKLFFSFTYPSYQYGSCQAYSLTYNQSIPAAIDEYSDVYFVENHLTFIGNLTVTGSYQGILKQGGRVHSNETLLWTGLKVVFNGTTDVYPDIKYFKVTVWDDDGDSWTDISTSAKMIIIETKADLVDDPSDIHIVNITNVAGNGKGLSQLTFKIKVESTKIEFSNPTPYIGTWQNQKTVTCGITISGKANRQLNVNSIQYSVSIKGPFTNNFGIWMNVGGSGFVMNVTTAVSVQLSNGNNNFIRWRVQNVGATIYSGSDIYQVYVDIEPVDYINPMPDKFTWQYSKSVNCSIIIYDNLSGVNKDSIQYRYSASGVGGYGSWSKTGLIIEDTSLINKDNNSVNGYNCIISINLVEGTNNFIQWRGYDISGNPLANSMHNQIKITLQKPISILTFPGNNSLLKDITTSLEWIGIDPNKQSISYDIYFSRELDKVRTFDESVKAAEQYPESIFDITDLKNGGIYYWTVIPFDAEYWGECQSGIWSFIVDLPPPITTMILPENNSIKTTTDVEFLWNTEYKGLEEVKYDLYLDDVNPPIDNVASDITSNYYRFNNLEKDKTYFWYVVTNISSELIKISGLTKPGVREFTIDLEKQESSPTVVLEGPKNNSIIITQQPTLSWKLTSNSSNSNEGMLSYTVILDDIPNPAQIINNSLTSTNFKLGQHLEFNKTYYWRVIPYRGRIEGICLSGIWTFNTSAITPEFGIELTLSKVKSRSEPGRKIELNFVIKNLATVKDMIKISFISPELQENIEIDPTSFELLPGEDSTGKIILNIPDDIQTKTYEITLVATSVVASKYGSEISTYKVITIEISKPEKQGLDLMMLALPIVIIITIVISMILVLKQLRKKKTSNISKEKAKPTTKTKNSETDSTHGVENKTKDVIKK